MSQSCEERVVILETAIKQMLAGAKSLERGEENTVECAQDLQRIAYAALRGMPLPDIFELNPLDAIATPLPAVSLPVIGVLNVDNPRDPRHKEWKL